MSIRALLADDHPVFLEGLRVLLESTGDIEVAGVAADGAALLDLARDHSFDVAVVDLDMPDLDGAEATRRLLRERPEAGVLMLTMHDDQASVTRALRAGARGYVLKGAGHGAIVRAIRSVADGDTVLGGAVGRAVLGAVTSGERTGAFPGLSDREIEVLALVARGHSNAAIADELFLSVKTVQNHVSSLLAKTRTGTRASLVAHARDAGVDGSGSGR